MITACQDQICTMLEKYGIMQLRDPRHIEAWIRTTHAGGGPAPDPVTMTMVISAIHKIGRNPAADNEVLAQSYGL